MRKAKAGGAAVGMAAALVTALLVTASSATAALAGPRGAGSTMDAVQATAKFHDLAVARHAGYGLLKDRTALPALPWTGCRRWGRWASTTPRARS